MTPEDCAKICDEIANDFKLDQFVSKNWPETNVAQICESTARACAAMIRMRAMKEKINAAPLPAGEYLHDAGSGEDFSRYRKA